MDERKGRLVAASKGLPVMGTVGVLREAHAAGMIGPDELRAAIETMQNAGIRLSERLIQSVLDELIEG